MGQPYIKPPLSFADQLALMQRRGMTVGHPVEAERQLQRIGYYRLSAYSFPFRLPDDTFRAGTSFERIVDLYEFDRRLRLLVLDAIERVEIGMRTAVTYNLANALGSFAHESPGSFQPKFRHSDWLSKVHAEAVQSNEAFVAHYQSKYDGFPALPVWMAAELMSIGTLSKMLANLRHPQQADIARGYNIPVPVLTSWMHTLSHVRNICAHHARLWNRQLAISPSMPHRDPLWQPPSVPRPNRIFAVLLILRHLLWRRGGDDGWHTSVATLIRPEASTPTGSFSMGLPAGWESHALWR